MALKHHAALVVQYAAVFLLGLFFICGLRRFFVICKTHKCLWLASLDLVEKLFAEEEVKVVELSVEEMVECAEISAEEKV